MLGLIFSGRQDSDSDVTTPDSPAPRMMNNESSRLISRDRSSSFSSSSLEAPRSVSTLRISKARRLLYWSHMFSQFSEISWQFGIVLFLAAFTNYQSLVLVSTYGIVSGLSVCLFGSAAGHFVDVSNRLFVARTFIWTENSAVLLATIFSYLLLSSPPMATASLDGQNSSNQGSSGFSGIPSDCWSLFLLISIHILGATAKIFDRGFVVAIERDWIVVMSTSILDDSLSMEEQLVVQKKWLSETNVAMKQIDLSCKVVAPAVTGLVIAYLDNGSDPHHGSDLRGAAAFIGGLNVIALFVEYFCTAAIYKLVPNLALQPTGLEKEDQLESDEVDQESQWQDQAGDVGQLGRPCICGAPRGLRIFLDQSVSWAGIGLSLLYVNVLTFGATMTAYLVSKGMRLESIGIWRGVSSAAGLAGTFTYHLSAKKMSIVATGMWSILFQFFCISVSYASLFVEDHNTSLGMLIAGVCASRVGLWIFDLSITQIMQDYIPDGIRGIVGGVQQSLNAFFGLLSFAIGVIVPDPDDFYIYVAAGYGSVGLAVLCYTFGIFIRRDKLGDHGECS